MIAWQLLDTHSELPQQMLCVYPPPFHAEAATVLPKGLAHEGAPRYAASLNKSLKTPPAVTSAPAPGPLHSTMPHQTPEAPLLACYTHITYCI